MLFSHHWGGIVGGFMFIAIFGACNFGSGPVGATRIGCSGGFILGGWDGTFPGLDIDVAFPGLTVSTSVLLCVWEGGA